MKIKLVIFVVVGAFAGPLKAKPIGIVDGFFCLKQLGELDKWKNRYHGIKKDCSEKLKLKEHHGAFVLSQVKKDLNQSKDWRAAFSLLDVFTDKRMLNLQTLYQQSAYLKTLFFPLGIFRLSNSQVNQLELLFQSKVVFASAPLGGKQKGDLPWPQSRKETRVMGHITKSDGTWVLDSGYSALLKHVDFFVELAPKQKPGELYGSSLAIAKLIGFLWKNCPGAIKNGQVSQIDRCLRPWLKTVDVQVYSPQKSKVLNQNIKILSSKK
jgi:hypothetical protein